MSEPTALELWLAREAVRAEQLSAVAAGSLERARSTLSAGCRDAHFDGCRLQVEGAKVHYSHPAHGSGDVTVRRLIAVASELRTDAKAEQVQAAYRAYVDEAFRNRVPYPKDWDAEPEQVAAAHAQFERYRVASQALEAACAAWWEPAVEPLEQLDMFALEDAA